MVKLFIYLGVSFIILGIIFYYFGDYMKWFGNLPGDVKIEKNNFKIFIPFTSMILLSILFSIVINFFKKNLT